MGSSSPLLRALAPALHRRHLVLWLWSAYWFSQRAFVRGGDWHYFRESSDLLFGRHPRGMTLPGGLHLFANYPEQHMGPLSVVLAGGFRLLPGDGRVPAGIFMCALGPLAVLLLERAAVAARGLRHAEEDDLLPFASLAGGLVFLRARVDVAGPVAHLDDVIVLAAAAVLVWAAATGRHRLAGAAVGIAIAGKSWGVLLLPLLACFGSGRALRAAAIATAIAAAAWLPFVLGDPGTLAALRVNQVNDASSGLRALGIHTLMTPHWLRPAQILLGLAVGGLAIARGRWAAALLVAVGTRLTLDPATFPYYTPGLVLAALAFDLVGSRRTFPAWTLASFLCLATVPQVVADPHLRGLARAGIALAPLALLAPLRHARLFPTPRPA